MTENKSQPVQEAKMAPATLQVAELFEDARNGLPIEAVLPHE